MEMTAFMKDLEGVQEFAWRLGGSQGRGINKLATLFTTCCARLGMQVYSRREYHSNIQGRHSYYDLSYGTEPVYSHSEKPDMAVCLDPESLCRHALVLPQGGWLIYPDDGLETPITRLGYLDEGLRNTLGVMLSCPAETLTVDTVLEQARHNGVECLAIPTTAFSQSLATELGLKRQDAQHYINTAMVAVSAALLGIPAPLFQQELERRSTSSSIWERNRHAAALAYTHAATLACQPIANPLQGTPPAEGQSLLLNGYQSVALGKLAAGLDFQTYYPISPASEESEYLLQSLPLLAETCDGQAPEVVQVEDELAAINMAAGAALTGRRCATATSGPGFSLMTEGLGWTGMNEVPLSISLYQRGGPSTGMPTRTEQGDLLFSICGGHGEFPRMVLASGDIEECFYDAAAALDYAAHYQMPVIHLLDKHLTSAVQTTPRFSRLTDTTFEERRVVPTPGEAVARFAWSADGISPRPHIGTADEQHWTTGVEHDVFGGVSENPHNREQMMEKRAAKLQQALADIPLSDKIHSYGDANAPVVVLFWGSVKGAALDAMRRLQARGKSVHLLQMRLLWPFPTAELTQMLDGNRRLVVVENNFSGQLASLLRSQTGHDYAHLVLKYSGRPLAGAPLAEVLEQLHEGHPQKRWVLRNPFE